ncbi:MAG: hypothetical protein ACI379_00305 [Nocardioides sp.]|uniref:hypothetical protein n=1 Tax=Nocardioides sp. TaxID=35761 RepID=UPI003EFCA67D
MSSGLRPKGPLPPRVYWVRRAIVIGVPLLVLGVILAIVFGGSADGKDDPDSAAALTSEQLDDPETTPPTTTTTPTPTKHTKTPPAQPTGPCEVSDVVITPEVPDPITSEGLAIDLKVKSRTSPACWFTVSSETVSVAITSGSDDIWFSRQCTDAITSEEVVARPGKAATVRFTWNLRRSDEECSAYTKWVRLGYYHVSAAPLGGEPVSVQFELTKPPAEVVTKTIEPKPEKDSKKDGKKSGRGASDDESGHRAGDGGGGVDEPND